MENLRGGNDSGISLNTGRNLGFSLQEPDDFGLSGLDLNTPSGLTLGARGRTHSRTGGTLNGYRETRLAFPAPGSTPVRLATLFLKAQNARSPSHSS